MRNLSANAVTEIMKKTGTEPLNIVEIDWPERDGSVTTSIYADRTVQGLSIDSLILSMSNIDEVVTLSDGATVAQVSMTFDDTDGSLKDKIDNYDIQKRPLRVYQFFNGLNYQADKFLVFSGETVTPIVWNERNREVSLEAITRTRDVEVGFAPEQGQFRDISAEHAGKVWPLCFGFPIYVPATLAHTNLVGSLMTRFAIPDPTLPYKKELLSYRRGVIRSAIGYFSDMIVRTNRRARPAAKIQEEYAHHIVAYDGLKQLIEDTALELQGLNVKLDEQIQEWTDPMSNRTRAEIEDEFKAVRSLRNKYRAIVRSLYAQQRQMEQAELSFKQELENSKFYVTTVDKLNKKIFKLKKDLVEISKEISIIAQAIDYQEALNNTSANVWDGKTFPQNQDKRYEINNAIFVGSMNSRVFNIKTITYSYRNIPLGDRRNESPDLFWLKPDPDDGLFKSGDGILVDLTNMYILCNDNMIVRVISQKIDGQCKIEMPGKVRSKKAIKKEVDYSGNAIDKNAFDTGLTRLLSGNETDEQKQQIADNIPKDLSPKIWDILHGNKRQQTIELKSGKGPTASGPVTEFTFSYFQLMYGDEGVTIPIYFDDSALTIKNKITDSILSLDADSITVTRLSGWADPNAVNGFRKIQIDFNSGLMKPFRLFEKVLYQDPLDDRIDNLIITSTGTGEGPQATLGVDRSVLVDPGMELFMTGELLLIVNGRNLPFLYEDIGDLDGAALQNILEATPARPYVDEEGAPGDILPICQAGEITCTGGPLRNSNITISYNEDFKPILCDASRVSIGKNDGDISLPIKLSNLLYNNDNDLWYQKLYFDRELLANPAQPLSVSGSFIFSLAGDDHTQRTQFSGFINMDGETITRIMIGANEIATTANFLAVGGPLETEDIIIYLSPSLLMSPYTLTLMEGLTDLKGTGVGLDAALEPSDFVSIFDPVYPKLALGVTYTGQGASEYTVSQREKKLVEQIEKNINSAGIMKHRKELKYAIADYREDLLAGKLLADTKFDLTKKLSNFVSAMSKVDDSSFNMEEVYKLINKEEKTLLYELEVLAYIEWKLKLEEVKDTENEEVEIYEYTALDITEIKEASPVVLKSWLAYLDVPPAPSLPDQESPETHKFWKMKQISLLPNLTTPFIGDVGDKITLEQDYQEKYICNTLPSTIKGVHAFKTEDGIRRLVQLSSHMYIKNENDETYGSQMTATSITMKRPLRFYDKHWEEGLYVTLESSVGPNVCDILKYIIENYTTCTVDEDSFDAVEVMQEKYPCNFALLNKQDAFSLIQDIAWQARCKLWIKDQVVYIMYLPKEPVPVATLDASNIEEGSLELSFTTTEDLVTTLKGTWKPDYAKDKDWEITVRRNVRRYGEQREDREIFIYNSEELVYKTITFWLIRWAGTYKMAKLRVFLDNLVLESNDYVTFSAPNPFADGEISGLVVKSDYDSVSNAIDLTVWLPVLAGTMVKYDFAMPADLVSSQRFPDAPDIVGGDAGNPNGINIPTGADFDPFDLDNLDTRPRDFGKPDIGDVNDLMPGNPASELDELAYEVTPDYKKISPEIRFQYSYTDMNVDPFNLEQDALEFQASSGEVTLGGRDNSFVAYGRLLRLVDSSTIDLPELEDTSAIKYYWVELLNGKTIKARPFQNSFIKVPYNQVILVVFDTFSNDYVFQPTLTTGKDFQDVKQ